MGVVAEREEGEREPLILFIPSEVQETDWKRGWKGSKSQMTGRKAKKFHLLGETQPLQ